MDGDDTHTLAVSSCSKPVVAITTFVATDVVYADSTVITVFAQGRSATASTVLDAFNVSVMMRLTGTGLGANGMVHTRQLVCATRTSFGDSCRLDVVIPNAWRYHNNSRNGAICGTSIAVTTSLDSSGTVHTIPVVQSTTELSSSTVRGSLTAVVTQHAVGPSDSFTIRVYANTSDVLESVVFDLALGPLLRVDNILPGGQWAGSVAVGAVSTTATIALMRSEQDAARAAAMTDAHAGELLATVTGHVAENAHNSPQLVEVVVNHSSLYAGSSLGSVRLVDRRGVWGNGTGVIVVEEPRLVDVIMNVQSNELFNTAVLTGIPQAFPLLITRVYSDGTRRNGTSDLLCFASTSNSTVMSANCTHVVLSGVESEGSSNSTTISVVDTSSGAVMEHPVTVRFPYGTVRVVFERRLLAPISGWFGSSSSSNGGETASTCGASRRQRFQDGRFAVLALFGTHAGDTNMVEIDVAPLVSSVGVNSIVFDPPGVVALGYADGADGGADESATIRGLAEGSTVLRVLNSHGKEIGTSRVLVGGPPVTVAGLEMTMVGGVSLSQSCTALNVLHGNQANVDVRVDSISTLVLENQSVFVVASAVLDDGSRVRLGPSDGVAMRSTQPGVIGVSVDGDAWRAIVDAHPSNVDGDIVTAEWTPPCGDDDLPPLAVGSAHVVVRVERPVSLSILVVGEGSVNATRMLIVSPQDAAALIGATTTIDFAVFANYADGRTVDITTDTRVSYNVLLPGVTVLPGRLSAIDTTPQSTNGSLVVSFDAVRGNNATSGSSSSSTTVVTATVPLVLAMTSRVLLKSSDGIETIGALPPLSNGGLVVAREATIFDRLGLNMTVELTSGDEITVPEQYGSYSTLVNNRFSFRDTADNITFTETGLYQFRGCEITLLDPSHFIVDLF